MKRIENKNISENLAISDEVLLMFNEKDTIITLNWERISDYSTHEWAAHFEFSPLV